MASNDPLFWAKVQKSAEADGCWLWTGPTVGTMKHGVLTRRAGGRHRQILAHRHAWEITNGPIPDGLWVLHRCDVPACVNPAHLYLGTHADNMRDMRERRRGRNRFSGLTACPKGHPFDEANTYVAKDGERGCRKCRAAAQAAYQQRKVQSCQ